VVGDSWARPGSGHTHAECLESCVLKPEKNEQAADRSPREYSVGACGDECLFQADAQRRALGAFRAHAACAGADGDRRDRRASTIPCARADRAAAALRFCARCFASVTKFTTQLSIASSSHKFGPHPFVSSGWGNRHAFSSAKIHERLRGSFSA
jgi:hypothetical protein